MIELSRANRLLDEGFSLVTLGANKVANYKWGDQQQRPLSKQELERRYNYRGGYFYITKDGDKLELPATEHIAIITGYDFMEVIDVDLKVFSTAKEQKAFWDEYLSFLKDNILDFHEKFVIVKTKNAGFHILYKTKRVQGNQKIASLKGHKEAIIETRGTGGYVLVYDNFLNGKSYNDIQFISDEDRDILFYISKTYHYEEPKKITPPKKTSEEFHRNDGDITPWDDFNQKNNVWDIVQADFTIVRNISNKYIIKRHNAESVHSGYIYKDNDLMYLFSTGTDYEAKRAYSAFSAYARKYFNDDFSEAAKQAYKDGYGTRIVRKEQEPVVTKIKYDSIDFPIEIFPEPIQQYIMNCHNTLDSIVDYMGGSLLWVLSVIIGNSMEVEVKRGWVEKTSLWIANIGRAGLGKTPSINKMLFPLNKINSREIKRYIKDHEKYEYYQSLSKEEKKTHEQISEPSKTQFIANDITVEALVQLHQENKNSVGVFKDELSGWMKDMNKYREGSDLEFWLSTWSGQSVNLNRITRAGSFVSHPHIPVIGGIQPNILSGFYTEENKDNGFIDRMLMTFPEMEISPYNDKEMPQDAIDWYSDIIINFYEKVKHKFIKYDEDGEVIPQRVRFSKDAKKEWARIFNKITNYQNSPEENEYMKSMYPKQKSYIPRFALIINTFDAFIHQTGNPTEITKESILKAEKLSDYFVSVAKKIKVNSANTKQMKTVINKAKEGNLAKKVENLYKSNPDFNRSEAAELLGCSRQTIYNHIKNLDK